MITGQKPYRSRGNIIPVWSQEWAGEFLLLSILERRLQEKGYPQGRPRISVEPGDEETSKTR